MSVCMLSPTGNHTYRWTRDFWLKSVGLILAVRKINCFQCNSMIFLDNIFFRSVPTSLHCIAGELVGGGWIDVAVCVSDMWQATGDVWHLTHNTFLYRSCYLHTIRHSVSHTWEVLPRVGNDHYWIVFFLLLWRLQISGFIFKLSVTCCVCQ